MQVGRNALLMISALIGATSGGAMYALTDSRGTCYLEFGTGTPPWNFVTVGWCKNPCTNDKCVEWYSSVAPGRSCRCDETLEPACCDLYYASSGGESYVHAWGNCSAIQASCPTGNFCDKVVTAALVELPECVTN